MPQNVLIPCFMMENDLFLYGFNLTNVFPKSMYYSVTGSNTRRTDTLEESPVSADKIRIARLYESSVFLRRYP